MAISDEQRLVTVEDLDPLLDGMADQLANDPLRQLETAGYLVRGLCP